MSDSLVIEKVLECADSIHLDMLFNIFPSGIIKDVMELQMMIGSKYDHRLSMILKKYYDIDDPKAYLDDFRSNKRQELIKRGSKPNKRRL